MSARVPFAKGIGKMLASASFQRVKGKVWSRDRGEVVQVVGLDKLPYSEETSLEFGVVLKEIWPEGKALAPHLGHLYHGLDLSGLEAEEKLFEHPRELGEEEIQVLRQDLIPRVEEFFERFDSAAKLRAYALSVENVVPIPRRELRDWAGFDYSVWSKK